MPLPLSRLAPIALLLLVGCTRPAQPEHFQILRADSSAVWRLDKGSGELWLCTASETGPTCYKAFEKQPPEQPSTSKKDFSYLWKAPASR